MPQPSFDFTVQDVFYIHPPLDRVILLGMVDQGEVRPGDSAVVKTQSGDYAVIVEAIEGFKVDELLRASAGQQVGLRLTGSMKANQATTGDKVEGKPRA